jgi:hypothetical protein
MPHDNGPSSPFDLDRHILTILHNEDPNIGRSGTGCGFSGSKALLPENHSFGKLPYCFGTEIVMLR